MTLSIRTRLTAWYSAVLLAILLLMGALAYSLLRWNVMRDLDASLLTVAAVVRDTGYGTDEGSPTIRAIHEILGVDLADELVRLLDPTGQLTAGSPSRARALPVSALARRNAARGEHTLETVTVDARDRVRLLTVPLVADGQVMRLVQVGMPLRRAEQALSRYLETLVVLIPLGLGLAVAGGALVARSALAPVDAMSRAARRITAEDLSRRIRVRGTDDELDRLADTLNAMLARLDAAFAEMRRFAADAAHELRTPLTVLRGEMEVALRGPRTGPEYERVLASALEEVDRLSRLASDLLLLSRMTAAEGLHHADVDLDAVLLEAAELGTRLASAAGVSLALGAVTQARVAGDAGALRRALQNLVENAVKYTPAGGKVELALTVEGRSARASVRDTGLGIAPADAARIFEPFVRLDAARGRDTGGAGLGLAIARSIVVAHGGTITVTSAPGAGSEFVVRLPLT